MIYVATDNYRTFQGFLQEFRLREHFGQGSNREGQAVYLSDPDRLQGIDRGIVLYWYAPYGPNIEAREIIDYHCAQRDIPVITVPDLRRERYRHEHPEAFPPTLRVPRVWSGDSGVRARKNSRSGGD